MSVSINRSLVFPSAALNRFQMSASMRPSRVMRVSEIAQSHSGTFAFAVVNGASPSNTAYGEIRYVFTPEGARFGILNRSPIRPV